MPAKPYSFLLVLACLLGLFLPAARGWVTDGQAPWPDGTVKLHLRLNAGLPPGDAAFAPDDIGKSAIESWNSFMGRLTLTTESESVVGTPSLGNGLNEVYFSTTIEGVAFPAGVNAATVVKVVGNVRTEADIIVNPAVIFTDNTYGVGIIMGASLPVAASLSASSTYNAASGYLRYLLRRETGLLLGLGRPDLAGQTVSSCMNAYSNADYRQSDDDQVGIASLYGEGLLSHLPEIIYESRSAELEPGEDLVLFVDAIYNSSFQWYKDGVPIDGATSPSLDIVNAGPADEGVYTLKAFNAWKSVTSSPIVVTVFKTPQPPRILSLSQGGTYKEGHWLQLNVSSRSGSPVQYQWYKDGVPLSGATSDTYTITDAMPVHTGVYRVELTNAVGTSRSADIPVSVDLPLMPTITDVPYSELGLEQGRPGGLGLNYTGAHCTYVWVKDGVPLGEPTPTPVPDPRLLSYNPYLALSFSSVQADNEGTYHLEVSNRAGTVSSKPIHITVLPPVVAELNILPAEINVDLGQAISLSGANWQLNGDRYFWYHDGVLTANHDDHLYIGSFQPGNAGVYQLVVVNDRGIARSGKCRISLGTENVQASSGLRDGTLYVVSAAKTSIERFNVQDGTSLAPIPLAAGKRIARISVGADGICVTQADRDVWFYRFSDASWNYMFYTNYDSPCHAFTSRTGTLFYMESVPYTPAKLYSRSLLGAAGPSSLLVSGVPDGGTPLSLQLNQDGSLFRGVFSIRTAHGLSFGLYSISAASPTSTPTISDYAAENTSCAWESGNGRSLVTDGGVVYEAASLRLLKHLDRPVRHLATAGTAGDFLLSGNLVLKIDGDSAISAWAPAPTGAVMLVPNGNALRILVRDGAGASSLVDFNMADFQEGLPPAATPQTPVGNSAVSGMDHAFVGQDGKLKLLDGAGARLISWSPDAKSVATVLNLRATPRDVCHDAGKDSLFIAYEGGLVTKLGLSSSSSESSFIHVPGEIYSVSAAAGRLIVWADQVGPGRSPLSSLYTFDSETGLQLDCTSLGWGISASWLPMRFSYSPSGRSIYLLDYSRRPDVSRYSSMPGEALSLAQSAAYYSESELTEYDSSKTGMVFRHTPQGDRTLMSTAVQIGLSYNGSSVSRKSHGAVLLDAATLAVLGRIPDRDVVDALWTEEASPRALVLTHSRGAARLARYSPGLDAEEAALALDCAPRFLRRLGDGSLLVMGLRAGVPRLFQVSADLSEVLWSGNLTTRQSLANLSIQADVGSGDDILVPGFVVSGSTPKTVMVRVVGPGLKDFKVNGLLPDPSVTLFDADGGSLGSNAGWINASNACYLQTRSQHVGAFPLSASSPDAVLMTSVSPGLFTAGAKGVSDVGGRALVELYDMDEGGGDSHFVNMSARCRVTPSSVSIGGFVIKGDKPMRVLVRAIGPRLAHYKVTNVLADPKLKLFRDQTVISSNDNWGETPGMEAVLKEAFTKTGAFPLIDGSKDAALLLDLEPGNYTAWMESADGGNGVALLELYVVE